MRRALLCFALSLATFGMCRSASPSAATQAVAASLPACTQGSGTFEVTVAMSPLALSNCQISGKQASGNGGALYVDGGATLTLTGVTITGNTAGNAGGGIFNNGTLNLTNVTMTNNSAPDDVGGAIFNNGTLTIASSTFRGNSGGYGGAIFNNGGAGLTITGSTFGGPSSGQGNTATRSGGAIYDSMGATSIAGSTFSGNATGYSGGALETYGGQIALHAVTLSGNHATEDAGAIQIGIGTLCNCGSGDPTVKITGNTAGTAGGGIENHDGQVTLDSATFSGNTAGSTGGGIQNKGGAYAFARSTFTANGPRNCAQAGGTITDNGGNSDSDGTCGFTQQTAPVAAGTQIAGDTFAGRSLTGGWGTASTGAAWVLRSGNASLLSVGSNEGRISGSSSSAFQTLILGTAAAANEEAVARYSTRAFGDDVGRLVLRFTNAQNYYAVGLGSPSGSPVLQVTRTSGGATLPLCSLPFSATNGRFYWERVRVQTSGSSAVLSARAWKSGTGEPSGWQVSCTDSAPLAAGLTGINGWDGGLSWSIDSFSAGNLGP